MNYHKITFIEKNWMYIKAKNGQIALRINFIKFIIQVILHKPDLRLTSSKNGELKICHIWGYKCPKVYTWEFSIERRRQICVNDNTP